MKRWMSALLAALLLALCVGCGNQAEEPSGIYYDITGIAPTETVMTVDGNEIPAQMYFYWTAYNCSYLEYQMNMLNYAYGMYADYIDADSGTVNWDLQFTEDQTLSEYAKAETDDTVLFYAVVENLAAEMDAGLTAEDETAIADNRASAVEEMGGEEEFVKYLAELGIDEDTFARFSSTSFLFDNLTDLVLQEGSELYLPEEGYDQYATYADHILLATQDSDHRRGPQRGGDRGEAPDRGGPAGPAPGLRRCGDPLRPAGGRVQRGPRAGGRTPTGTSTPPAPWSPPLRTRRRPWSPARSAASWRAITATTSSCGRT